MEMISLATPTETPQKEETPIRATKAEVRKAKRKEMGRKRQEGQRGRAREGVVKRGKRPVRKDHAWKQAKKAGVAEESSEGGGALAAMAPDPIIQSASPFFKGPRHLPEGSPGA